MYMKFRGTRHVKDVGVVLSHLTAFAIIHDKMGLRKCMEDRMCREFYQIKSTHLAYVPNFLNSKDRTKQVLSKTFHITYFWLMFRNFFLCDKDGGYLERKERRTVMIKLETLLDTRPD